MGWELQVAAVGLWEEDLAEEVAAVIGVVFLAEEEIVAVVALEEDGSYENQTF